MKITQADYNEMRDKIKTVFNKDKQAEYKKAGLSDMRYRWDCFHAANCYKKELYDYLYDEHIDTALRSIISELS